MPTLMKSTIQMMTARFCRNNRLLKVIFMLLMLEYLSMEGFTIGSIEHDVVGLWDLVDMYQLARRTDTVLRECI